MSGPIDKDDYLIFFPRKSLFAACAHSRIPSQVRGLSKYTQSGYHYIPYFIFDPEEGKKIADLACCFVPNFSDLYAENLCCRLQKLAVRGDGSSGSRVLRGFESGGMACVPLHIAGLPTGECVGGVSQSGDVGEDLGEDLGYDRTAFGRSGQVRRRRGGPVPLRRRVTRRN